jgi:glycosyltransferase involved in cell wall biosynthesis
MKIIVVEPVAQGGLIHYAYQLCTALADQGASVTLITAQAYELEHLPHNFCIDTRLRLWHAFDPKSTHPPSGRVAVVWRKVIRSLRRLARGLRLVQQYAALTRYLIKQKPDVVQFGIIRFPFMAYFLAKLRRHGLVLSQIGHEYELRERSGSRFVAILNRLQAPAYKYFSIIFFHGEVPRQQFLSMFRYPVSQTYLIEHGNESLFLANTLKDQSLFEVDQYYHLEKHDKVVLFFGIFQPSKGLPDLIEAFARVYQQSPHTRMLIVGYPSKHFDITRLRRSAADYGVENRVVIDARYVPIEQVGPLIQRARVVVFPYRSGTQSGALQVAYAFGRPVVATTVGNMADVVEEGRSGFLVPPNCPDRLADAILRVVVDQRLAQQMGAYAKHLSDTRFAWEPIAANILAVYSRHVGRERRP